LLKKPSTPSSNKELKTTTFTISVAARQSPLSKTQVQEVLSELRKHYPLVNFIITYLSTTGDKDQKTSLRTMEKTDFFTKEIDAHQLIGKCRITIHSAKDLPEPISQGLHVAAITKGVDSSDSLVLRNNTSLKDLPNGAIIATSSQRREEVVKEVRSDLRFSDIRGTIHQRLEKLHKGDADGVVIAEAALIRLGLTHLNRIKLPGETTPFQGQLAIVVREDDTEMRSLFSCVDVRK